MPVNWNEKTSESIVSTEFHSCIFTVIGLLQMQFFVFSNNAYCNERIVLWKSKEINLSNYVLK
jgi:hypothetical protein